MSLLKTYLKHIALIIKGVLNHIDFEAILNDIDNNIEIINNNNRNNNPNNHNNHNNDNDNHNDNNNNHNGSNIKRELERQINELRKINEEKEKQNKEYERKIRELKAMMERNIEEHNRKEIERKKELIEKEKIKRQKEIEENKMEQEAILKVKESLNNEFTKAIIQAIKKYTIEEEKWTNKLNDGNINKKLSEYKKRLHSLFEELYRYEKIPEKLIEEFNNITKKNSDNKKLTKMNIMLIGSCGTGKSTLINSLFGEKMAREGIGKSCTTIGQKCTSKSYPFLNLYDTVGAEVGKGHTLETVQKETLDLITKNLNNKDPNEHIHCLIYCTTSNRIFEDELKVILKIRERYNNKKLPIVIACTRALDDEETEAKKLAINEFLSNHGEEISDDVFGISFIKLNAKEKIWKKMGRKFCDPCYGLSDLMTACYKKGIESYKIAIKNSLIEIVKNELYNYIKKTSNLLSNNINFFLYLSKKFEPNFSDFISYAFEKITDIENKEGIKDYELRQLENYLGIKTPQNFILTPNHINNFREKDGNNISSDEKTCIYCRKPPKSPYKCENCGKLACEKCYLMQFNYYDNVKCIICGKSESFIKDNTNSNNNETNEIIDCPISSKIYGQENTEDDNNNFNLLNPPSFKDVGEHVVYYKITSPEINEVIGSNKVKIYGIRNIASDIMVKDNSLVLKNNSFNTLTNKVNVYAERSSYKHYDTNNSLVNSDAIKTGDRLVISISGKDAYNYELSVLGDMTGDGKINSADLLRLRQHLIGTKTSQGVYYLAGDINNDSKLNSADLLRVRQHLIGTRLIS